MRGLRASARRWLPRILTSPRGALNGRQFASYEEALEQCGSAYDADQVAEVVAAKTRVARDTLLRGVSDVDIGSLRILMGLGMASTGRPLRVIDFGGAAGYHYFLARALLPVEVQWHVVETASMVRAAQDLQSDELRFFDSIDGAMRDWHQPPDLVFASGVLQCFPEPVSALRELMATRAQVLFITRTGLSSLASSQVIVLDTRLSSNGPGPLPVGVADFEVSFPLVFAPRADFEAVLAESYDIKARLIEDRGAYNAPGVSVDTFGYACTRSARIPGDGRP